MPAIDLTSCADRLHPGSEVRVVWSEPLRLGEEGAYRFALGHTPDLPVGAALTDRSVSNR